MLPSKNVNYATIQLMKKEWYIRVEDRTEGPYSKEELRDDPRVVITTLAWKEGMPHWLPIYQIPELATFFTKPKKVKIDQIEPNEGDVTTLTLQQDPQYYVLWILLLMIIVLYVYYQFIH